MKQKQAITAAITKRYKKSNKKEKSMILDEFVATTGYNRSYAARALRGAPLKQKKTAVKRLRPRTYDDAVLKALQKIWAVMDMPCGKRLAPMVPEMIKKLKQFKEIELTKATEEKLLNISAATIDRMLLKDRKKMQLKGRSWTKPGTLLKHQIPIRTFADWNENHPGFMEIDLVGHDSGGNRGDFCRTLDVTDAYSS